MLGVMGEKYETDDIDELMLPGFRFHPTDQELVGFYLKRKVQQWPLSIELIKPLDIYKYDPWDLPKLATTGEQEWYFYCPRDRKFRNSARPNRVTEAGFWKATGTDRPIYSSDQGTKCIGLKKSLVFYRGRASKGIKTDWMMHEFRLPSLPANLAARKKTSHNNLPPMDSWAICRIFFKKTNSVAQRALSHSCISSLPVNMGSDVQTSSSTCTNRSSLENITSCATDLPSSSSSTTNLSPINFGLPSFLSFMNGDPPMFSTDLDLMKDPSKSTNDVASMLLNLSPALLGDMGKASDSIDLAMVQHQYSTDFSMPREIQKNVHMGEGLYMGQDHTTSYGLQEYPSNLCDAWRSNMLWDYLSSPTEMSINYSNVSGTLD